MGRLRKSGRKGVTPDQYFAAGPIELARIGKLVVVRSRATSAQHRDVTEKMGALLPQVVSDIDILVEKIAQRVSRVPAYKLLHRAYWEFAFIALTKTVSDVENSGLLRIISYIQSVIASIPPSPNQESDLSNDEWVSLSREVNELFQRITSEYQTCRTADVLVKDPSSDIKIEGFRFSIEMVWMQVRGKRYHVHERQALDELISPHSDELIKLFGIDAKSLVADLDNILMKLTGGVGKSMLALTSLQEDTMPRLAALARASHITSIDQLRDELWDDPLLSARRDEVIADLFGANLFDVEKNTSLPKALIDELTWDPGEETEFFADGEFRGWPLRVWPTMKRPFIRLNDCVLCFDLWTLFDNFYRVLQRIIFRLDPGYRSLWNQRQKRVSEELPFRYFRKILPQMINWTPVYYLWGKCTEKPKRFETDGLIVADDHLFVLEIKGGAFTYTSPATDLNAHMDSLKGLLRAPATQGGRFVDYLESNSEVAIYDEHSAEIGRLRRSDFRHVAIVTVTLDAFTELASRAQHLKVVGVDVGPRPVWSLSLDDLRVYSELFTNPLTFLHFVEQRMAAAASEHIDLDDELDHLGLYLQHNHYALYASEIVGDRHAHLGFNGYRTRIDDYYSSILQGKSAVIPTQEVPARIKSIVDFLANSNRRGRAEISSFLLDAASDQRTKLSEYIDDQLETHRKLRRTRPMSCYGGHAFTLYIWSPEAPRDAVKSLEHTKIVAAAANENDRLLIELEYFEDELVEIHWQHVVLDTIPEAERTKLTAAAERLRKDRIRAALSRGKIRVNTKCPCGSGLKYKKCCKP